MPTPTRPERERWKTVPASLKAAIAATAGERGRPIQRERELERRPSKRERERARVRRSLPCRCPCKRRHCQVAESPSPSPLREGETEFHVCSEERDALRERAPNSKEKRERFRSSSTAILELHIVGVHGGSLVVGEHRRSEGRMRWCWWWSATSLPPETALFSPYSSATAITEFWLLPPLRVALWAVTLFPRSFATAAAEYGCQSCCPTFVTSINCRSSGCICALSVRLTVVAAEASKVDVVTDVVAD
ncbi:hypothetical protein PIB30_063313 [Stylosanthes scabra]|uniref:Uncharacterized protein n=1 Tax=Stylosanthes scabra TaxID=79078 RepID=A0ABU6RLG6_9FABA|nr:hypothetical protein [Stylosanthes scabra]